MHHGTCVTHVPWCMSGSHACSDGENVPGIPGACAPAILRIWQEAHGFTHSRWRGGYHHHGANKWLLHLFPLLPPPRTWWRHQMETFSALLAICVGNSPVNSTHKGQWCGALIFSLICARINGWVNNREAGYLRCHHAHYDIIVMKLWDFSTDKKSRNREYINADAAAQWEPVNSCNTAVPLSSLSV